MKKLLSLLLVCIFLVIPLVSCENGQEDITEETTTIEQETTTAAAKKVTSSLITIMSLNLWGDNQPNATTWDTYKTSFDGSIATRGSYVKEMLAGEQPDIVGFQEARPMWQNFFADWLDGEDYKGTYNYVLHQTYEHDEGGLILYNRNKFQEMEDGIFWLYTGAPTTSKKFSESNFDRMCSWVLLLDKATNKLLLFADTHLDTAGEDCTNKQATVLTNKLIEMQEEFETYYRLTCRIVLVGDMNSRYGGTTYYTLTKNLNDSRKCSVGTTMDDKSSTSPGFRFCATPDDVLLKNGHIIDMILVSKKGISVKNYKMISCSTNFSPYGEYISDHNAIFAEIKY